MEPNTKENTPPHCHFRIRGGACPKFKDCRQAQNMLANTEPVDAYVLDGGSYCKDCAPVGAEFVGDMGETDSPDHCEECGVPLKCSLTEYGVEYVKEKLKEGGGCCRELWPVLFPECVPNDDEEEDGDEDDEEDDEEDDW